MRIQRLQTAVYWEPASTNEYGETVFNTPVELLVRWEDKQEKYMSVTGEELVSSSIVYPAKALSLKGYLYLGNLSSLTNSQKTNPKLVPSAKEIKSVSATPSISNRFTVYKITM